MTQFDQKDQVVSGDQQNAGHDINNNIFPKALWAPPVMLPPRAQSFVGREEDLAWLLQQLKSEAGMTLALCGPGGMGKTALAAEALTRLITQQDWLVRFPGGIFYHSFYTSPSLAVAFEEIARIFEQELRGDPHRAAIRALSRRRTLLVFDGVEVLADPLPLWNLGGTHVVLLLSRRQSDAPDLAHRRTLDLLSPNQAITLLQELAGSRAADHTSVQRLVQLISGYPLALQLIGSYLSSRQEEVADYLRWFESEGLAAVNYGKHQAQSIPVLLQRTYDTLTSSEQQVFVLLGLLAPAPFPLQLIQAILELPERAVRQALGSLVNLNMLRRPDQGYEVSHPLVHTFATECLVSQGHAASFPSSDIITTWRERFLTTLVTHFDQSDPYDRIALALWQPHVFPLWSAKHLAAGQSLRAASLFNKVGFAATTQGRNAEVEPLLVYALAIREQQLGADHPDTATSLNSLAFLYENQGKYAQAKPLYERALAIREQQLGADHPDTATSLNNLAALYWGQGKYTQAELLLERALKIREQQLGTDHPITATSLNNLATLYERQGKYSKAELLFVHALAICEQQLGADHPTTATNLNNLALLYKNQGKYAQAEPLYLRALAIHEQRLGTRHPDTATSLNNLAGLYGSQGRYAQAEPLYERALAIYEQQLGADHPTIATNLSNLAGLYGSQGRYAQAKPLLERALAICEHSLGREHPLTQTVRKNYAILLQTMGLNTI
jgi:tetratricopeptide (TPR) repeat protein